MPLAVVLTHLGAGRISGNGDKFLSLLRDNYSFVHRQKSISSNQASEQRKQNLTLDLAAASLAHLEDSGIVNAGCGSSLNANGIAQCDACVLSVVRGVPVEFSAIACLERVKNPIKAARALYSTDLNAKGTQKPILIAGEGAYEFAVASGCELSDSEVQASHRVQKEFSFNKALAFPTQINDTIGIAILQPEQIVACCSTGGPSIKLSGRLGHVPIPGAASWAIAGKDATVCVLSSGNGEMLLMSRLCEAFSKVFLATSNPQVLKNFLAKEAARYEFGIIACKVFALSGQQPSGNYHTEVLVAHSTLNFAYSAYVLGEENQKSFIHAITQREREHLLFFQMHSLC